MSLSITIDGTEYKSNNIFWNRNLDEWLNDLKQQLITGINIVITSTNSDFTGPKLSNFFNGMSALLNCKDLDCRSNNLSALPALPFCTFIICSKNILTVLPALPVCTHLNCDTNQLTVLPELLNCTHLYCGNNQLTELPALPNVYKIKCEGNPYLDYTQEFATKFNLSWPSPRMVQSAKNRAALAVALSPSTKGRLTDGEASIPDFLVKGKVSQSNIQSFLGGNVPLKYMIDYTSNKSSNYPFLLNL